jgi:quercetin dioxygenase-like cupin family protein
MDVEEPQLPFLNRFITAHDQNGKAVFSTQISESMPRQEVNGFPFSLAYTSNEFPAQLSGDADITKYKANLNSPPGLAISTGTVCRIVDFPPAAESPMHRTVSLDYGVVLEGEVELSLDSGEKRVMKRGDVAIQRATNHAWKNVTPNGGCARMLYVLTPCQPIQVEGLGVLGEVVEGIDVKASE